MSGMPAGPAAALTPAPCCPPQVYLRWLLDSEVYNEWMNPNDYETEEFQKEQEELKARGITGEGGGLGAGPLVCLHVHGVQWLQLGRGMSVWL